VVADAAAVVADAAAVVADAAVVGEDVDFLLLPQAAMTKAPAPSTANTL
jgi:hypothetical protein